MACSYKCELPLILYKHVIGFFLNKIKSHSYNFENHIILDFIFTYADMNSLYHILLLNNQHL